MRHARLVLPFAVALSAGAAPLSAAEQPSAPDKLDRCLKSVNVIGASMGHKEKTGPDGKAMLYFVVRANGSDYNVKCDADTGMVTDVSAYLRQVQEN